MNTSEQKTETWMVPGLPSYMVKEGEAVSTITFEKDKLIAFVESLRTELKKAQEEKLDALKLKGMWSDLAFETDFHRDEYCKELIDWMKKNDWRYYSINGKWGWRKGFDSSGQIYHETTEELYQSYVKYVDERIRIQEQNTTPAAS